MIDWKTYKTIEWSNGDSLEHTKKEIISILREQKVSLSRTRFLFNLILEEIEDKNPISI